MKKKCLFLLTLPLLLVSCNEDKNSNEILNKVSFTYDAENMTASINGVLDNKTDVYLDIPEKVKLENKYYTITEVSEKAFSNNSYLEYVNLPKTVKKIGNQGFARCTQLHHIYMPGVETIDAYAFDQASAIDDLELPETLTYIGKGAFRNCTSVEQLIDNSNNSVIKDNVFEGNTQLKYVFAKSYTKIGRNAFYNCKNLKGVYFTSSETAIEYDTNNTYFESATKHYNTTYGFDSTTQDYDYIYDVDNKTCKISGIKKDKKVVEELPKTLKFMNEDYSINIIGKNSFKGSVLEKINLHDQIKTIETSAFENTNLSTIDLSKVDSVYSQAFKNCKLLTSVKMNKEVTTMQTSTFEGCEKLSSFVIPENITSLPSKYFKGCTSLNNVVVYKTLTKISDDSFNDCSSLNTIYYTGSEEEWQTLLTNSGETLRKYLVDDLKVSIIFNHQVQEEA